MKKPLKSAFFGILLFLLVSCSSEKSSTPTSPSATNNSVNSEYIEWVNSSVIYGDSPQVKPLSILYFTDDVCSDGFLMEYNTFLDSEIITLLNQSYNIARISTSNDSLIHFYDSTMTGNQLFKLYNLVGVPSMLVLDSDDKYFGRIQSGYYPSDTFKVLLEFYNAKVK